MREVAGAPSLSASFAEAIVLPPEPTASCQALTRPWPSGSGAASRRKLLPGFTRLLVLGLQCPEHTGRRAPRFIPRRNPSSAVEPQCQPRVLQ